MNWIALKSEEQLRQLQKESEFEPVLIFKHSTRCSISSSVLNRLERNWKEEDMASMKTYYLDLISHRSISNLIATIFDVEHQSPQIIVVRNGSPILVRSHYDISFAGIQETVFAKS